MAVARVRARAVARVSPLAIAKNNVNTYLLHEKSAKIPGVGWWWN